MLAQKANSNKWTIELGESQLKGAIARSVYEFTALLSRVYGRYYVHKQKTMN